MSEIAYAYRPAPCPAYDIEGMESWLGDMAARGLVLSSDGFFASLGIFEKRDPVSLKYRLEAAPRARSYDNDMPDSEAVSLSEELGWHYIARRGEFYIYCAESTTERELNTDPGVQALALKQVIRRRRSSLFLTVLDVLFLAAIWSGGRMPLSLLMISLGTLYVSWILAVLLAFFARSVYQTVHLTRLYKKLKTNGYIDHGKNWRRSTVRYHVINAVLVCSVLGIVCIGMSKFSDSVLDEGYVPLEAYTGDPPFATIADLFPEGKYEANDFIIPNEVKKWSTLITPVNIDWCEYADVALPDGRVMDGALTVYYHEAATPWLARWIAGDYLRWGKSDNRTYFEQYEIDSYGLDYAAAYQGRIHTPCVILQNGCRVMWIQFYETGEDICTEDEWIAAFAASLREMSGQCHPPYSEIAASSCVFCADMIQ